MLIKKIKYVGKKVFVLLSEISSRRLMPLQPGRRCNAALLRCARRCPGCAAAQAAPETERCGKRCNKFFESHRNSMKFHTFPFSFSFFFTKIQRIPLSCLLRRRVSGLHGPPGDDLSFELQRYQVLQKSLGPKHQTSALWINRPSHLQENLKQS